MAKGNRALDGNTRQSLIAAIVASYPRPLWELQPLAAMSLEHLIARCIAKDPDERWQSAADLKWELLRTQSDLTGSAAKESRSRGSRVAWTVAAAAIVLSAVLASIAVRRTSSPRPIRFTVGPPSGSTRDRVNASGGVPQQLTRFEAARGDSTHRWPYFLPDGKHFLFMIRSPSNAELRGDAVYVASVDSPTPRLLLHASSNVSYTDAGYLLYLRDQTLLAQRFNLRNLQLESTPVAVTNDRMQYHPAGFGLFSSSRTGVLAYGSGSRISSLLWVDRHGHTGPVIAAGADYFAPRLSADQRQILYSLPDDTSGNRDLWLFDISRHVSRRVTFHPWDSFAGVLTPDGKQLIFSSNRSGTPSLYIKRVQLTDEKLLLGGSAPSFIESMSPDGRVV